MSPACDGVSVFHTFQLQSGRVPSFSPGNGGVLAPASHAAGATCRDLTGVFLKPPILAIRGPKANESSSTVHLRSPIQTFPSPVVHRQVDATTSAFPQLRTSSFPTEHARWGRISTGH